MMYNRFVIKNRSWIGRKLNLYNVVMKDKINFMLRNNENQTDRKSWYVGWIGLFVVILIGILVGIVISVSIFQSVI